MTRKNSTLVWWGKSGWTQISAPTVCQDCPATEKSGLSTTMTKCGLPLDTDIPEISLPLASITAVDANVGTPMPVVTSTEEPVVWYTGLRGQMRMPASVSIFNWSPGRELGDAAIHAATQRVPLPLISAMEPSALCKRIRPEAGVGFVSFASFLFVSFLLVQAKNSMPSAPMPVLRAQRRRVRFAQS